MEPKTVIGQNNFLFLSTELDFHSKNVDDIEIQKIKNLYGPYISKMLLVIFPNKCCTCRNQLPDTNRKQISENRTRLEIYKTIFDSHLIYNDDNFEMNDFYKTDSHMNLRGCYKVYKQFLEKAKETLNIHVEETKCKIHEIETNINNLGLGLGDLSWKSNLGEQVLKSNLDTFYFCDEIEMIYCKRIIDSNKSLKVLSYQTLADETTLFEGQKVEWGNIISPKILYQKNENKSHKVLIFYDSFLLSTLSLYLSMFYEVYLVKTPFNSNLVKKINPDFVFEFRIERFLI